jgi:hypothetical protein
MFSRLKDWRRVLTRHDIGDRGHLFGHRLFAESAYHHNLRAFS